MDYNKIIAETTNYQFIGEYQETRNYNFECSQGGSKRTEIIFSKEGDDNLNYGFNNLRITGDLKKIDEIILGYRKIGEPSAKIDCMIDQIYPSLTKQNTFLIMGSNILPAIKEYEWLIQIIYSDNIQISIDVNKITNPLKDNESANIIFTSHQYTGSEYVNVGKNYCRLNFNYLCNKIIIVSMAWLYDIQLFLRNIEDMNNDNSISIKQTDIISEYKFDNPVNMSKYTSIILKYDSNDISYIHVFMQGYNVLNVNKNKVQLQFSS
jgi:hypothetical protein